MTTNLEWASQSVEPSGDVEEVTASSASSASRNPNVLRRAAMQLPRVAYPQAEARARRRKGFDVQYGGDFDLAAELLESFRPLAAEVAGLGGTVMARDSSGGGVEVPGWRLVGREVRGAVDAVEVLWAAVSKMLSDGGQLSGIARASVAEMVGRGPFVVSDEMLAAGTWAEELAARVEPLAADLSALLGRSGVPHGCTSGQSDMLNSALRTVDRAAAAVARAVPRVREKQRVTAAWVAREEQRAQVRAEQALRRLGL